MNCPKSIWILAAGVLLGGVACGPQTSEELLYSADARYAKWVGKTIDHQFQALDGQVVSLEKLRGKVVLLDFWATWCPPCMKELPHLKEVYNRLHPQGFEIVGFSFDTDRQQLLRVLKQHQIEWPQYFDGATGGSDVGRKFGIRHYPSMWLLDKEGKVRFISAGANLEEKAKKLLREGNGQTTNDPSLSRPAAYIAKARELVSPAENQVDPPVVNEDNGDSTVIESPGATSAPFHVYVTGVFAGNEVRMAMLKVEGHSVTLEPGHVQTVPAPPDDVTLTCQSIDKNEIVLDWVRGSRSGSIRLPVE